MGIAEELVGEGLQRAHRMWGSTGASSGCGGGGGTGHVYKMGHSAGDFGMTPWCDDLVCSWRRLLADRHSLPFPWTLSLHRQWCPSASHHPLTFLSHSAGGGGRGVRAKSNSWWGISLWEIFAEVPGIVCGKFRGHSQKCCGA